MTYKGHLNTKLWHCKNINMKKYNNKIMQHTNQIKQNHTKRNEKNRVEVK